MSGPRLRSEKEKRRNKWKSLFFRGRNFPRKLASRAEAKRPRQEAESQQTDETRHFCPVRQRDSPHCPLLQGHLFIFFFIHNAWKVPDISDPVPGQTLTHVFTSDFSFHYLSTKVSLCRTGSSVSSDKMSNLRQNVKYTEHKNWSGEVLINLLKKKILRGGCWFILYNSSSDRRARSY